MSESLVLFAQVSDVAPCPLVLFLVESFKLRWMFTPGKSLSNQQKID